MIGEKTIHGVGIGLWLMFGGLFYLLCVNAPENLTLDRGNLEQIKQGPWNGVYKVKGKFYTPMELEEARHYHAVGWASWYGEETYRLPGGNTTANGEPFDPDFISAAHRTLPLPSRVRVTNLENGRSLNLRVNDRGPFPSDYNPASGDRLIDLSAGAARKLGFYKKGLAWVRVEVISG